MSSGRLGVSDVPSQHVPLNQADSRREMHLVSRKSALVRPKSFPLDGRSLQPAERIEAFELKTTVIAKKLMQTSDPQHNQGIVVATLNSGTLTSRAPHSTGNLTNLMASKGNNFFGCGRIEKPGMQAPKS
jgi:hypothetical protein